MVRSGYSFAAVEVEFQKYNKTLNVRPLRKPVSFVFPRAMMFPSTPSRETSGHLGIACVASVSVRFKRKEQGTRVKDREKSGASKRAGRGWFPSFPYPSPSFTFWLSFHFSRGQNRKSPSSVFLCSETKRKRLLRRLISGKQN